MLGHGPLALFIVQAALIIAVSRLIGVGARRIRQPMVIAEIVAGIALGPSLLGWLAPGVSAALFPKESMSLLSMLSQVGLMLFMFLVGLEFDAKLLRGRGHTSVAISHTSIVVPFGLGALLALYFYPRLSDSTVKFSSFTLFMGVAMSITAFPVLARILVEHRLLRSRVGAVTITCAAIDDVTAWCILAFVVAIVRVTDIMSAVRTSILAVGYAAVMLLVVRPLMRRLSERSANKAGLSQNLVAMTMLMLLASSWTTELIGIHALFGAFLVGAVIPKENGFAKALADKLEDLVVVLLLPLFFAYSGLRTQIGLLDTPGAWAMCGLVILVACLGKFGGSAVAARLTGLSWRESTVLGILMNTRGLMELVVLNIGLDLGVISPTLFTMMVLMALVTTFVTSPLLDWVYPIAEREKDMAEPEPAVVPQRKEGFTVLACVSYERSGPGMIALAGAIGGPAAKGTRLYALRLVRPADRASFVLDQHEARQDEGLVPLLDRARELELDVRPLSFVSSQPSEDICSVAAVKRADLVLLGWHKPLLGKAILGGTVYDVMRRAPADVGVFVDRGLARIERVLVPYLGSVHDRAALRLSRRLAANAGAEVTILHVTRPTVGSKLGVEQRVREVYEEPGGPRVNFQVVEHESPVEAALEEAGRGYDLVLIGVGPEWGLEHRPFGLQSEAIISRCPASLLVVRQHQAPAAVTAEAPEAARASARVPADSVPAG